MKEKVSTVNPYEVRVARTNQILKILAESEKQTSWHHPSRQTFPISSAILFKIFSKSLSHLQGDVACGGGCALQHLVIAAASTAHEHYTGWNENVLDVIWILLMNLHKYLPWPAHRLIVDFGKGHDCGGIYTAIL